jgi:transcriptional regulator with XRE-family HTH domain
MSIVHEQASSAPAATDASIVPPTTGPPKRMHRIATVRQEQGVSLRSASRQMGRTMSTVRMQEDEANDLRISDLLKWQQVLGVPLQDLLVDPGATLSTPVMERARLLRLMKTAAAIKETADSVGTQRLADMLIQQLVEVMPELKEVSAWHSVGQRRSLDEYGRIVERRISDDVFQKYGGE